MEEHNEITNNDKSKIKWNQVTWYSQIFAIIIGVSIFIIGFSLGSTGKSDLQLQYKILSEKQAGWKGDIENLNSLINTLEKEKTTLLHQSNAVLSGTCFAGHFELSESLYETIEDKLSAKYPADDFDTSSNNPEFHCSLDNGTRVASFVFDVMKEGEYDTTRFRIVQFDEIGEIIKISPHNVDDSTGGRFLFNDVVNGVINFESHVGDPCYDALHTYSYNLYTSEFTEQMEGGDDMECWERLNAAGGV